jgi:hypothetical protein
MMEIPCLFTKIFLVIGDPIKVPVGLNVKESRVWVSQLTDVMEMLDKQTKSMVQGKK